MFLSIMEKFWAGCRGTIIQALFYFNAMIFQEDVQKLAKGDLLRLGDEIIIAFIWLDIDANVPIARVKNNQLFCFLGHTISESAGLMIHVHCDIGTAWIMSTLVSVL